MLLLCTSCYRQSESKEIPSQNQLGDGSYTNIQYMLNDCKGLTIVTAIGEQKGYLSSAKVRLVVIDSTNTFYTCNIGGTLGIEKGDTLKY